MPNMKINFCRLWARSGILYSLIKCIGLFYKDKEDGEDYVIMITEILITFTRSDHVLHRHWSQLNVLGELFSIVRKLKGKSKTNVLNVINRLSSNMIMCKPLQKAGAIEHLVRLLKSERRKQMQTNSAGPVQEHPNVQYLIHAIYNMSLLSPHRVKIFAQVGVVPLLEHYVKLGLSSAILSLPVLCDIGLHSSAKKYFKKNDGVNFIIQEIFPNMYHCMQGMKILRFWLTSDERIESKLLLEDNIYGLKQFVINSSNVPGNFKQVALDDLQYLIKSSKKICKALVDIDLIGAVISLIEQELSIGRLVPIIRFLIQIIRTCKDPEKIIEYDIIGLAKDFEHGAGVMVQALGEDLKNQCNQILQNKD
eukprot:TRINITY_DN7827_c0_g1_i1.p1 TRINITY_DN7827_c0_g1~~TRINITY_DN7827_c0_g1_i1.p1  ORF type:complete len:373 (-),score=66.97 TRINITY_DN7827_c0_g1_i1:41-1135(-)